MSNPTGDALNAVGLKDDGGVIRPADSSHENATKEQLDLRDLAALMRRAPLPTLRDRTG